MGGVNFGGLVSGLDSNSLIEQLVQLERQPIIRLQQRIQTAEQEQQTLRDLRGTLSTLRSEAQRFQFGTIFEQFAAPSSNENVLETALAEGTPTRGAFTIDVQQLATATEAQSSAPLGAAINPNVALDSSGIGTAVQGGTFTINGESFTIDPATDSLNNILSQINSSNAGVIATFDSATDTVTFENDTSGNTSIINFGASGDDSNFLDAINVTGATQFTNASGSTEVESTRNLGAVNPDAILNTVNFAGGAITAGSFRVNGVSINVDPATDTLNTVLARINSGDTQVTASADTATDRVRVISDALGSRTVGFESGSSNFLDVTNLTSAAQTQGTDAQFTVNGGPVQTRNTNEITDAIGGVQLNLQSVGTSTVTVSRDDDAIVEDVQGFIDSFNAAVTEIRELTGDEGALERDISIRTIESRLRQEIFGTVGDATGGFQTLLDIGITTGENFDSAAIPQLELNEETFRGALSDNLEGVQSLFSNDGDSGVGDRLDTFLESIVSTQGFLNQRARPGGSIDDSIESLRDRIERIEFRVENFEERLRAQFAQLEQFVANFQQQGASLQGLGGGFGGF